MGSRGWGEGLCRQGGVRSCWHVLEGGTGAGEGRWKLQEMRLTEGTRVSVLAAGEVRLCPVRSGWRGAEGCSGKIPQVALIGPKLF